MKWSEIERSVKFIDKKGIVDFEVKAVEIDSRKITPDSVFIAIKGVSSDGHTYIPKAIESGAKAVVCESFPDTLSNDIAYVRVENSSIAAGILADQFFDHPTRKLKLVGVTGTNGKTTTATLLYRLMKSMGFKTGLLSTIKNYIHDQELYTMHTTPDIISINKLLKDMVEAGCIYAFMEVSSHAMVQGRVAGLKFAGGIFTNITHDHLDYHGTFQNYLYAKKSFFDSLASDAFAIINKDDKNGPVMVQNCKAHVLYYGLKTMCEYKGKIKANTLQGLILDINGVEVHSRLVGAFNAYNFIGVYAAAVQLGFDSTEVLERLSNLMPVDGRFDTVYNAAKKILGIVDYAHTPDALMNVLDTIQELKNPEARIITVVGCGGDRDKTKRPIMTKIAVEKSNLVILTSDNPRSEDPNQILDDMVAGLEVEDKKKVLRNADRKEAIKMAASMANISGDIILVAGKGHENYQEIKGQRFPFDDKVLLEEMIV